jgi:two-component sensor histidine kinase
LANINTVLQKYSEARSNLQNAMIIAKELKDTSAVISVNYLNAALLLSQQDKKSALAVLRENDEIFKVHKNWRGIGFKENYETIAEALGKAGEEKLAYKYLRLYVAELDSVTKKNDLAIISDLEIKYQTEKKENEILKLNQIQAEKELEVAAQKRNIRNLIIGILGLALLPGVSFYLYRKTVKEKEFISELQTETHHRIKNNLSIISSFIDVAKDKVLDQPTQLTLSDLQNRIGAISEVHRLLHKSKLIDGKVAMGEYLGTLVGLIKETLSDEQHTFDLKIGDNSRLSQTLTAPLGLIINEFATNSIKHNPNVSGEISLALEQNGANFKVVLIDEAAVLKPNFSTEKSVGYGIRLISSLTKQMQGSGQWNTEKGLKYTLTFNEG